MLTSGPLPYGRGSVQTGSTGALRPVASILAVLTIVSVAVPGCRNEPQQPPPALTSTAERGPFRFEVEVRPQQARVGDQITIDLRARTPADYTVQFPDASAFEGLEVHAATEPEVRPAPEGGHIWRRRFVVVAYESGEIEIPALTLHYGPEDSGQGRRGDSDQELEFENELVSDAITLPVASALTTRDSITSPRDITGALRPPPEPLSAWQWTAIIAGAVTAIAVFAGLWWYLRRIASRPAPPVSPEVVALRALAGLDPDAYLQRRQARDFYYRLTEIVRVYIEQKFALAAPEMTTEEFLAMLARDGSALPYDTARLRSFLEACDLVKYAAFEPGREDAHNALSAARAFVDSTAAALTRAQAESAAGSPAGRPTAAPRQASAEPQHEEARA